MNNSPFMRRVMEFCAKKLGSNNPHHLQNFSLPNSIIYYITMNPTNPELYKQMIKSCKYFYFKNPILVSRLIIEGKNKWRISHTNMDISLTNVKFKFWIIDDFYIDPTPDNILSLIIPKIYQCNAKGINFHQQQITYNDFVSLISSAVEIFLYDVIVKYKNGSIVTFEKLFESFLNCQFVTFLSGSTLSSISFKTMKKLLNIPHFLTLNRISLGYLSGNFDLDSFYDYMKKNKRTKFFLTFADSISDEFKNRLELIIDEIIDTETFDYKPPYIHPFVGLDQEKVYKMKTFAWP